MSNAPLPGEKTSGGRCLVCSWKLPKLVAVGFDTEPVPEYTITIVCPECGGVMSSHSTEAQTRRTQAVGQS